MEKIKVGITHGDPNGVGYEVILKTFSDPTILELCTPIIYGSPKLAAFHRKALDLNVPCATLNDARSATDGKVNLVDCLQGQEVKVEYGQATEEAGLAALCALEKAMQDYQDGLFDVLVTAPINKHAIQSEKFRFPGHTEYIEEKVGNGQEALMILMQNELRVALATTHIPIKDIAQTITKELIVKKVTILHEALKRDFFCSAPRIAVLALNPHAGDDCLIGMEEHDKISPAIEELAANGIQCFGPYPADGFFGSGAHQKFDAILAMYHDQGLAPFKALAMENGVNFTAGLSIVRTSPAHGTAYDIAGQNLANENSFRQALYTALDVFRNRNSYDYAQRNPLRKVYRDKHNDSEKLKLD